MTYLLGVIRRVGRAQRKSNKPLAIVLAGHNGSGKSTMWYKHLADEFKIPLINADRMMLSILPELSAKKPSLPEWALTLRDKNSSWMQVAQKGVEAFVAQAMARKVPFAMETVFSHWKKKPNGKIESKIDLIRQLQKQGYFVLLLFVGLSNSKLSILRVETRVKDGGHRVDRNKLVERFSRTQMAIQAAALVADATILTDNSGPAGKAFNVCRVQLGKSVIFDCRKVDAVVQPSILAWLNIVSPQ
jgi:predicted ABC-type ATPase